MILASGLFTYAVNISTDIGQYIITSLSGYNQQKYYINAITASTKDVTLCYINGIVSGLCAWFSSKAFGYLIYYNSTPES